jgi:hypothetical protein
LIIVNQAQICREGETRKRGKKKKKIRKKKERRIWRKDGE